MERRVVFLDPLGSHASPILSHTLFGATCWALATLSQDVGAMLKRFADGGPRFAFSNAYPYVRTQEGERLLLLPRPPFRVPPDVVAAYPEHPITQRVDLAKRLQKAGFVSQGVAERLRTAHWDAGGLFEQALRGEVHVYNGALWLKAELDRIWGRPSGGTSRGEPALSRPWEHAIIQRNSVDRMTGSTGEGLLFQQTETFYDRRRAGLWFGVWSDETLWPALQGALRFVADTGLGGNRSVGKGHFDFSAPEAWDRYFPAPPTRRCFLNLSHYIPATPGETQAQTYSLDLIRQKAEHRYPQEEQRIFVAALRAFQPGGLFAATPAEERLYGRLLPLAEVDDHTVYYSGITLPLWGAWEVYYADL
jgi:CRISPR type III-A-associated RAMP protein Csm4